MDDNAQFLAAARDLLEREGVSVVGVASSTVQALRQADALRPEVALIDVELGDESGFDLARRLADRPDPVRVVLISTYSEDDLDELVQTSPAVGFLSKRDVSRRAIDALLAGR
ncbi:response regulator [Baekduia alba]|uniref:response regulator n=1 Tax=Baekduia alba TaxID=2997333 RepID=UPI00234282E2|nr:response regulator [Baekduia alba]